MIYVTLTIAVAALACSIVALIASRKKDVVVKETTVKVEHAPVEHQFTYDSERTTYTLDGNLEVTGCVTALKKGGEE